MSPSLFITPETLAPENRKKIEFKTLLSGYWTLLLDKRFISLSMPICALAASYWIYIGVSALYMMDYLGLPQSQYAWYQGPIAAGFSLISMASSWLYKKFGINRCIIGGLIPLLIGSTSLLVLNICGYHSAVLTTVLMTLICAGQAPICALLFPYVLKGLPPNLQGSGQSMIQALRLVIASIGSLILGFVYTGAFLPVAIIIFVLVMVSTWFLWIARVFYNGIGTEDVENILVGGH